MPPHDSYEAILGVPKPPCCNLKAACCSISTPSIPAAQLFEAAAHGTLPEKSTAQDFLSVFVPHKTHQAARDFYPEDPSHVDRVLALAAGSDLKATITPDEVVFYHCRYLDEQRRCKVYEDRPEFCRNYPTSPMNLLVKGCGYEAWARQCRDKLRTLGYAVDEGLF